MPSRKCLILGDEFTPSRLFRDYVHKFLAPLGQRGVTYKGLAMPSVRIEHLNAIVSPVGYVYRAVVAHVDAGRSVELTVA